ncbi:hypothetical protein FOPG_18086 [Fusarium oxysporum f. sp. conglutinans race 2 54008]|uniref:Uncharacterized protein n=1 Tax=Fusarium oxysporum f. sp. conglutinans race 2 54008 TaxID=1089457 RepID=X0H0S0_FUSOX|nr:hypothetical protein FOPG_18086 [Fusarium oxysporum f. sp. conglutinans race 2 54008]
MTNQGPETQQIKRWLDIAGIKDMKQLAMLKDVPKAATAGLQALAVLLNRGGLQDTSAERS